MTTNRYSYSSLFEKSQAARDYAQQLEEDGWPNAAAVIRELCNAAEEAGKMLSTGPLDEARELLIRALDRMEMYDPLAQVREDIEGYLRRSNATVESR
jgi:hypothetical protein